MSKPPHLPLASDCHGGRCQHAVVVGANIQDTELQAALRMSEDDPELQAALQASLETENDVILQDSQESDLIHQAIQESLRYHNAMNIGQEVM